MDYKPQRNELETIILVNQADRRDGYFTFSTSYKPHWDRLVRTVGEQSLRDVRLGTVAGKPVEWRASVPNIALAPSMGLRDPVKAANRKHKLAGTKPVGFNSTENSPEGTDD